MRTVLRPPAGSRLARRPSGVLAAAVVLLLAGCASSSSEYYALRPWPGTAQPGGPPVIEVRTPSVPSSLDRDYIVRSHQGYELKLDDSAAWSEPLADMIGETLAQDLQQRLPGTAVYTATGAISAAPTATLELDVTQFADDGSGEAVVAGTLALRPTAGHGGPIRAEPLRFTTPVAAKDTQALVGALSRLLGQVADTAATDARRLSWTASPGATSPGTMFPAPADAVAPVPLTTAPPVPFAAAATR